MIDALGVDLAAGGVEGEEKAGDRDEVGVGIEFGGWLLQRILHLRVGAVLGQS